MALNHEAFPCGFGIWWRIKLFYMRPPMTHLSNKGQPSVLEVNCTVTEKEVEAASLKAREILLFVINCRHSQAAADT